MTQTDGWQIRYELKSASGGPCVARGHIKDYPSAEEALMRLGERVGTAVAAELRSVTDPAAWPLLLSFEILGPAPAVDAEADTDELADPDREERPSFAEGIDLAQADPSAEDLG